MLSAHRSYRRDWLPQSSLSSSSSQFPSRTIPFPKLAGAEGFEPPSPVLETGSLTVELTPLDRLSAFSARLSANTILSHWPNARCRPPIAYFVSLCDVCLRQNLQNLLYSRRPVVVFLFLVVE